MRRTHIPTIDNSNIQKTNQSLDITTNLLSRRIFLHHAILRTTLIIPITLLAACGTDTLTDRNAASITGTTANNEKKGKGLLIPNLADTKLAFTEIMNDENTHITLLQSALKKAGITPRPKPIFKKLKQMNLNTFLRLAQLFENTAVGTYLMATSLVNDRSYLNTLATIQTIAARHAGFLNALSNKPLSLNGAFDRPQSQAEIMKVLAPFIADIHGGADPLTPFLKDEEILNFALLLEMLEAEFYNVNVPDLFA